MRTVSDLFRLKPAALALAAALCASLAATPARADFRYEQNLLELSEILGNLHHLDRMCTAYDDTLWRTRMRELLAHEEAQGHRRFAMVSRFNLGYREVGLVHDHCSPPARLIIEHLHDRGEALLAWFTQWRRTH